MATNLPATSFNPEKIKADAMAVADQMNTAVDVAYAPGLSYLEQQKQDIPGMFNPYRNAADLQARVDAKTLDERMANMGLTSSGTNLTGQTAIDTTRQNVMGQITAAEAKTVQEVQAKIADFIAQRDSKKAENIGVALNKVADATAQFNLAVAGAEINFHFQSLVQAQEQVNTIALRKLDEQIMIAQEQRNFEKEKELNIQRSNLVKEQAAQAAKLNYDYAVKLASHNAGLKATTTKAKTSLTKDERETIDGTTKGIMAKLEASGGEVSYKDVATIAKQYKPGTLEYNYAMAGIGKAGVSETYAKSAINATSGSSTAAASAWGLTVLDEFMGGNPNSGSDAEVISFVRAKYTPGSDNYNYALIAMGRGDLVTGPAAAAPKEKKVRGYTK